MRASFRLTIPFSSRIVLQALGLACLVGLAVLLSSAAQSVDNSDSNGGALEGEGRIRGGYHQEYVLLTSMELYSHFYQFMFNPTNDHVYLFLKFGNRAIMRWLPDGGVDTLGFVQLPGDAGDLNLVGQVLEDGRRIWFWQEGLGEVFEYDIASGATTLISETIVNNLMHGQASLVTPDDILWAVGGVGLFEVKNLLLTFDPSMSRDWQYRPPDSDPPARGHGGHMWYRPERHELIYLVPEFEEGHPDPLMTDSWILYVYSIDRNAWRKRRHFRLDRVMSTFNQGRRYHSTDGRYAHILEQFMLDMDELRIVWVDSKISREVDSEMMFFSPRMGQWVVAGQDRIISKTNARVAVLDPSDMMFTNVTRSALTASPFMAVAVASAGLLAGMGVMALVLLVNRRRRRILEAAAEPSFKVIAEGSEVSVIRGGEKLLLVDPNLKRLWRLVHRMAAEGRTEILLSDLDQKIFMNAQSISQNSRLRNRLFDILEEQVGRPFVAVDKSGTDSRYKVVRFELSGITFQSE